MSDISRDSFDPSKDYLGVYLQQGRPLLDADWNEAQDIVRAALGDLGRATFGTGTPDDHGFEIAACDALLSPAYYGDLAGHDRERFGAFLALPGPQHETFDHLDDFARSDGHALRLGGDYPYRDRPFLRVSGHEDGTEVTKKLSDAGTPLVADVAVLWLKINTPSLAPEAVEFFIEDTQGRRNRWTASALIHEVNNALGGGEWLPFVVAPLNLGPTILTGCLPALTRGAAYAVKLQVGGFQGTLNVNVQPPGYLQWDAGSGELRGANAGKVPAGTPTTVTFDVTVTDSGNRKAQRRYENVPVRTGGHVVDMSNTSAWGPWRLDRGGQPGAVQNGIAAALAEGSYDPAKGPADLAHVRAFGVKVSQQPDRSLTWDLGRLSFDTEPAYVQRLHTDVVIRGNDVDRLRAQMVAFWLYYLTDLKGPGLPTFQQALESTELDPELVIQLAEIRRSGVHPVRLYVNGLACTRRYDELYSDNLGADPGSQSPWIWDLQDGGTERVDIAYLDTWVDTVTAAAEPALHEEALGGIDTATRRRLRHVVRVAPNAKSCETPEGMPADPGPGTGTLEASGCYVGGANALYRVDIELTGPLGTATFRWSSGNGADIRPILRVDPAGARLDVPDTSGLAAGDAVVVRVGDRESSHRVDSVTASTVVLRTSVPVIPTSGGIASVLQRWDDHSVATAVDPLDPTMSRPVALGTSGIRLRFGQGEFRAGDYWTFRVRTSTGPDDPGVEPFHFVRPQSTPHWYVPLACVTRRAAALEPGALTRYLIDDTEAFRSLRPRLGP